MSIGYSKHPWGKVQNIHGKFQTSTQKVQDIHGYQQKSTWKAQISVENSYRSIRIVQDAHRRCQIPTRQAPQHHQNPTQMISSQHHAFLTPPLPPPQNMNHGPITAPDIPSISTVPFCPVNSNHTSCGTACPTTCNDAAVPSDCTSSSCVEGCTCTEGFVLDAGKCIPKSECGCVFGDRLYGLGEEFWGDDGCTKRCVCEKERRKAVCHQASCRAKEECGVKDGIRGCYPTSYGVCTAVGSTHYRSFDGKWFAFQGTCFYQLVGLCKRSAGLVDFQVLVQNGLEGGGSPSFITIVRVKVYGNIITFNQTNPNKITVSSPQFLLPHPQFLCSPLPSPQPNLVIPVLLLPFFSLCLGIAEYMTQRNRDFFLPPCD